MENYEYTVLERGKKRQYVGCSVWMSEGEGFHCTTNKTIDNTNELDFIHITATINQQKQLERKKNEAMNTTEYKKYISCVACKSG